MYSHAYGGEPLLTCDDLAEARSRALAVSSNSSKFYAILGGALGTVAFLILIFCCVRFFLLSSSSSAAARRRARRLGDSHGGAGGDNRGGGMNGDNDRPLRHSVSVLPYAHL